MFPAEQREDMTAEHASQMTLAFQSPESAYFSLSAGQYSRRRLRRLGSGYTACVRATC